MGTANSYSTPEITVRVFEGIESLTSLIPAWEQLLAAVPSATIFSTHEWLLSWWRIFGKEKRLLTVAAFNRRGDLIGLTQLSVEQRRIAGLLPLRIVRLMGAGRGADSEDLDILVVPGYEEVYVCELLNFLLSESVQWDLVELEFSHTSPIPPYLRRELERRNLAVHPHEHFGIVIDLVENWASYLKRLSRGRRKKTRGYARALERQFEVCVRKSETEPQLSKDLAAFFDMHQRRWFEKNEPGAFASDERKQFYAELARRLGMCGRLEFRVLELNGKVVAGLFEVRYRDTVYALQSAFDPAYSAWHPGFVLKNYMLQHFMECGVRHYDFLAGQDIYKTRWRGRVATYHEIHFAQPRTRGSIYLGIEAAVRTAKDRVRPHLSPALWAHARRLKQKFHGEVDHESDD